MCAFHVHHRLNSDEGSVLLSAWGIRLGRMPYIDDFQFITPGSGYLIAALWWVFGPHFVVAKAAGIVGILLTCLAIMRLTEALDDGRTSTGTMWVGAVLYAIMSSAWQAINHNTFNAAAMAWSLWFVVRAFRTERRRDMAIAGALSGVAILFVQHKGVALAAALVATLMWFALRARERGALQRAVLFGVLAILPALSLTLFWPHDLLYEQLVEFPRRHYLAVNRTSGWPLWLALGYLMSLLLAVRPMWSRRLALVVAAQLGLLATALQRTDFGHVLIIAFPLFALLPLCLAGRTDARTGVRVLVHRVLATMLLAAPLLLGVKLALEAPRVFADVTTGWPLLRKMKADCRSIHAGPFLPGLYYELRVPNPTSYPYLLSDFNTPEQFARARAQLDAALPACIAMGYKRVAHFGYRRDTPIEALIREWYQEVAADDQVTLFMRRP